MTVSAPRAVLRVRIDGTGLGAAVCLCPDLWVVWGGRQLWLAQSQVSTAALWTGVVQCLE